MTVFTAFVMIAALVETFIQIFKSFTAPKDYIFFFLGGVVGTLLCYNFSLNLFGALDVVSRWDWIGYVCTGLLAGRGSQGVHDAFSWLQSKKLSAQNELAE